MKYFFDMPDYLQSRNGVLTRIEYPGGYSIDYTYNANGRLESLTDTYNRTISFEYNTVSWVLFDDLGNITEQIFADNGGVNQEPDRIATISKVTFPDGTYMEYDYDNITRFDQKWSVPSRLIRATKYDINGDEINQETYHYEDPRHKYALTGITDDSMIRYATWTYDSIGRAWRIDQLRFEGQSRRDKCSWT